MMEIKELTDREKRTMHNRAECMKRVNTYINNVVPVLIAQLNTGFKTKVNRDLYEKDRDILKGIINAVECPLSGGTEGRMLSNVWLRADEYSVKVEVKDTYVHVDYNGTTNRNYNHVCYLWNHQSGEAYDFKPLVFYTGNQLISANIRLRVVNAELSTLKDEASALGHLIGGKH